MDRKICCFAGHGKYDYGKVTGEELFFKCWHLIDSHGVNEFWVGNYGNFDILAANIVEDFKKLNIDIKLNLVLPYFSMRKNEYDKPYYKKFDNIFLAEIPPKTPRRYRIIKCNQYMVDNADYLICFVAEPGGAAKTLEYAKQKKSIEIFNLVNYNF